MIKCKQFKSSKTKSKATKENRLLGKLHSFSSRIIFVSRRDIRANKLNLIALNESFMFTGSQIALGLKEPSRVILSNAPAASRDTSNYIRFFLVLQKKYF